MEENREQTCIKPEEISLDDQRLRALHILQILQEETDEDHPISTSRLMKMMEERYQTTMHRTRVPLDLSALSAAGYEIGARRTQVYSYYYDGWKFDLAELKLLIDAVESSKYISEKKSQELVEKLSSLTSKWNAEGLKRSVAVPGRRKNDGKNIITMVDVLHRAINTGKKVSFRYFRYNNNKRRELTNQGNPYTLSPYHLIWDGDYYYVLGFCDDRNEVRTFRVDRILNVPDILDAPAIKKPKGYRISKYTNDAFRMFVDQEPVEVTLKCQGHMMNSVIDKFGKAFQSTAYADGSFTVTAPVCVGPTFYGWVCGGQGAIRILGPDKVKEDYRQFLAEAQEGI